MSRRSSRRRGRGRRRGRDQQPAVDIPTKFERVAGFPPPPAPQVSAPADKWPVAVDDWRWDIPLGAQEGMRVPGRVYANETLRDLLQGDGSMRQAGQHGDTAGDSRPRPRNARRTPRLWSAGRRGLCYRRSDRRRLPRRLRVRHQLRGASAPRRYERGRPAGPARPAGRTSYSSRYRVGWGRAAASAKPRQARAGADTRCPLGGPGPGWAGKQT